MYAFRLGEAGSKLVAVLFNDISDRKRSEELIRASETRLRAVVANLPKGAAFIVDHDLRYLFADGEALRDAGFTTQDFEGRTISESLPQALAEGIIPNYRKALSGESFLDEHRSHDRNYITHGVPLYDSENKVVAALAVSYDITDRMLMERERESLMQQLRTSDRRKDEFLAVLAHELRNPLAPIRNAVQIMKMSEENGIRQEAQDLIERQLVQMVRLVDDLMDVSRISSNKLELKKEKISLGTVIHNAVETSRPLIDEMGHHLTVHLPQQPIYVDADPTRLAQALLNLLNNSAKYSDPGGDVCLTVERQGQEVAISVRDSGIGIPGEDLPTVFDLFTQIEGGISRSRGGLGIGLSLVRRLVEMHGGSISVQSDGLGKGSIFTIRLPVLLEGSPVAKQSGDQSAASSALRILIVDDNRDSANSLAMMLKITGNETRTAYDGEQAVAFADSFKPDVVLLDIGLPKLNGYEACRRIREQPNGKKCVVIAQTGWGQEEDRQRTREAGFDHHFVKPVDPQALMKLLATLQ